MVSDVGSGSLIVADRISSGVGDSFFGAPYQPFGRICHSQSVLLEKQMLPKHYLLYLGFIFCD